MDKFLLIKAMDKSNYGHVEKKCGFGNWRKVGGRGRET